MVVAPVQPSAVVPSGLAPQAGCEVLVRPYGAGLVIWSWLIAYRSTYRILASPATPAFSWALNWSTMAMIRAWVFASCALLDGVWPRSGKLASTTKLAPLPTIWFLDRAASS